MRWALLGILLGFSSTWAFMQNTQYPIHWKYIDLKNQLKLEKRKLIYFHFPGCSGCKQLELVTFVDSLIGMKLENYDCLNVNRDTLDNLDLCKKFDVKFYPTLLLLDKESNVKHKIVGYLSPQSFLLELIKFEKDDSIYDKVQNFPNDLNSMIAKCNILALANELDSSMIRNTFDMFDSTTFKSDNFVDFTNRYLYFNRTINLTYQHIAFQYIKSNLHRFYATNDTDVINAKIISVVYREFNEQLAYSPDKALVLIDEMNKLNPKNFYFLSENQTNTGIMFVPNLIVSMRKDYFRAIEDWNRYCQNFEQFRNGIWDDQMSLHVSCYCDLDKKYSSIEIKEKIIFCKRLLTLNISSDNNFNLLKLYHLSNNSKAIKRQLKNVDKRKLSNENLSDYNKLFGSVY